ASRRRHTRCYRDWSSDVCSSDLLVQDQLLPGLERLGLDRWVEVHLDLPTLREDVDGRVLVGGEVDAVRRGRRAELVHLFLERGRSEERRVGKVCRRREWTQS